MRKVASGLNKLLKKTLGMKIVRVDKTRAGHLGTGIALVEKITDKGIFGWVPNEGSEPTYVTLNVNGKNIFKTAAGVKKMKGWLISSRSSKFGNF